MWDRFFQQRANIGITRSCMRWYVRKKYLTWVKTTEIPNWCARKFYLGCSQSTHRFQNPKVMIIRYSIEIYRNIHYNYKEYVPSKHLKVGNHLIIRYSIEMYRNIHYNYKEYVPSKHLKVGYHPSNSKALFKWSFAGGPIVTTPCAGSDV